MNDILRHTPIEEYNGIHVKREDLCVSPKYARMFPPFSKLRGVHEWITDRKNEGFKEIGVLDTVHSQAGWGVAAFCHLLDLTCVNYYPMCKGEVQMRPNQLRAQTLGALMVPMPATKSAVLWYKARKDLALHYPQSAMIPNGLKLSDCVRGNADEVRTIPKELMKGTWVFSVSTGTIMAGVMRGIAEIADPRDIQLIAHMGYSRSKEGLMNYLVGKSGVFNARIEIIDEGYAYADRTDYPAPFYCDPFYDRKAWKWINEHKNELTEPIIMWNVG
jgi:hypothetical protein